MGSIGPILQDQARSPSDLEVRILHRIGTRRLRLIHIQGKTELRCFLSPNYDLAGINIDTSDRASFIILLKEYLEREKREKYVDREMRIFVVVFVTVCIFFRFFQLLFVTCYKLCD